MFAYLAFFRRGFAFDIPGLIFARVFPILVLCLAGMALYEQGKRGVRDCQHSYFVAGSQPSLKAKSEAFCYTPFATRIQTGNPEQQPSFHGHYTIMAPYFLVVAVIFIFPDLLMAFSGIPTKILRNAASRQRQPEAIARDLLKWLDRHFEEPDQPDSGVQDEPTTEAALPSSPAASFSRIQTQGTDSDNGGEVASSLAEAVTDQSAAGAHVTTPRGWAQHRWTSKSSWRLVACFAAARAGSIFLCPLIIIFSDTLFFNDSVLLHSWAIFEDNDGICRTTVFDDGDESRPIRLKAVCSLTANFSFRWMVLLEYGALILLAPGMIGATIYSILQYRRRVDFVAAAVGRHLREKRKAIDHADVRAFAEYLPADLWFCLRLLANRNLSSLKVNAIAGILYEKCRRRGTCRSGRVA